MVCDQFWPKIVVATAISMEAETMLAGQGIPEMTIVSTLHEPN